MLWKLYSRRVEIVLTMLFLVTLARLWTNKMY
jgi:hypothetical protein